MIIAISNKHFGRRFKNLISVDTMNVRGNRYYSILIYKHHWSGQLIWLDDRKYRKIFGIFCNIYANNLKVSAV